MEIDKDRIDDAILALLYLTLDGDGRAWKGFDWSAMNRLHEKGFIGDPVNKAKSFAQIVTGCPEFIYSLSSAGSGKILNVACDKGNLVTDVRSCSWPGGRNTSGKCW